MLDVLIDAGKTGLIFVLLIFAAALVVHLLGRID
ncbi:hypothetical protein LCGC14_0370170 [marine sediment metagenome]|uniref:Uncharacterized protein n=1 Tax=marine sediment metagenome TaxID=412755 RepID=A0A0F9WE38_9ZZZZ